jgi:ABC-type transport system involved in multi-copper enzyme maturation permease subunit
VRIVAVHVLRESLRRRVFVVVLVLSVLFLALYTLGVSQLFRDVDSFGSPLGVEPETVVGATILGLAMFAVMFLGTVLATFLTLSAIRGDAERGLLQPLIVRPLGRTSYVVARLLAAATVSAVYVVVLFVACTIVTGVLGWWPNRVVQPALALASAMVVVSALSVMGSVVLSTTANGIAVLMIFGAGLVAGLLGQIGESLNSDTLRQIAEVASWVVPFEALYQEGLSQLTADVTGTTQAIVQLGPLGGAQNAGIALWPYAVAYVAAVTGLSAALFARRDL